MKSGIIDLFTDSGIDKLPITKGQGDKIIVNDHGSEKTFYFYYEQLKEVHPHDILMKKKNE
jgi:hypothetical protein